MKQALAEHLVHEPGNIWEPYHFVHSLHWQSRGPWMCWALPKARDTSNDMRRLSFWSAGVKAALRVAEVGLLRVASAGLAAVGLPKRACEDVKAGEG